MTADRETELFKWIGGNDSIMTSVNLTGQRFSRKLSDQKILTDMVKNIENGLALIEKWLRNKNTIEFLGIWEEMYNPDFNSPEFEGIKNQAGLNRYVLNMALFGMTAKEWRESHPDEKGNIRDYANVSQLVCLSNLENLNALFVREKAPQSERLRKLNQIAIQQMRLLTDDVGIKRLKAGEDHIQNER